MIITFVIILILALSLSSKFRESLLTVINDFSKLFDSTIIKYKNSPFKLLFILLVAQLLLDFILGSSFSIFEIPSSIFYNFISDLFGALIILWLFNRVSLVLSNITLLQLLDIKFGLFKIIVVALLTIAVILGFNYISTPIISIFPKIEIFEEIRTEFLIKPQNVFETLLLIISICIIPAIIEEILFRGLLYNILRTKYSIAVTIIVIIVAFYLFHLDPQMIPIIIVGNVLLCLVYEYTKSLLTPIIIHFGINLSTVIIFLNNIKAT